MAERWNVATGHHILSAETNLNHTSTSSPTISKWKTLSAFHLTGIPSETTVEQAVAGQRNSPAHCPSPRRQVPRNPLSTKLPFDQALLETLSSVEYRRCSTLHGQRHRVRSGRVQKLMLPAGCVRRRLRSEWASLPAICRPARNDPCADVKSRPQPKIRRFGRSGG